MVFKVLFREAAHTELSIKLKKNCQKIANKIFYQVKIISAELL